MDKCIIILILMEDEDFGQPACEYCPCNCDCDGQCMTPEGCDKCGCSEQSETDEEDDLGFLW